MQNSKGKRERVLERKKWKGRKETQMQRNNEE